MSPVTTSGTQSDIKKRSFVRGSGDTRLNTEALQRGMAAFTQLQTVERALRLDDLDDQDLASRMAKNIVANERNKCQLTDFIRPLAGYEYADWTPIVEQVATACIKQAKAAKSKTSKTLAHVG